MSDVQPVDAVALDRRRFLGGAWRAEATDPAMSRSTKRMSDATRVLVQAAPARLDAVAIAVATIDGVRVLDRRPPGRLVVAVPTAEIAASLQTLAEMPGVLTASVLPPETHRAHADDIASSEIAP